MLDLHPRDAALEQLCACGHPVLLGRHPRERRLGGRPLANMVTVDIPGMSLVTTFAHALQRGAWGVPELGVLRHGFVTLA